jgi:hypothetical protein
MLAVLKAVGVVAQHGLLPASTRPRHAQADGLRQTWQAAKETRVAKQLVPGAADRTELHEARSAVVLHAVECQVKHAHQEFDWESLERHCRSRRTVCLWFCFCCCAGWGACDVDGASVCFLLKTQLTQL